MSSIFDVVQTFVELAYDEAIIEEIKSVLDDGSTGLRDSDVEPTAASAYGSSDGGVALARNADLARQKVIEAITDMAAGLQGYRENVDEFHSRTQGIEGDSTAASSSIDKATDCVAQPKIASPSSCGLPGASGSGR